jgi:NAD(P)H-hydrate epimerase
MNIEIEKATVPVIYTDQMIEVDRLMINSYGITLLQMMENAGRNLALLAKHMLGEDIINRKICIIVGNGNNGGGGLVAARHLSNWGAEVTVLVATPAATFKPVAAQQLEIVRHLPISVVFAGNQAEYIDWCSCQLVIDAIFGYGLNRSPVGMVADIIQTINTVDCPVLSLDAPSGLHTTNGYISDTVVRADATLTLALPKTGLLKSEARSSVGELYIGDISVPSLLYCQLGIKVGPIFEKNPIIQFSPLEVEHEALGVKR